MKVGVLPLFVSLTLMVGCAGEFQATGSGSSAGDVSSPDTSIQDSIDRMNQQMAADAGANAAAQQQFQAGMAAAQETENNANNDPAISNW
jgi:hypothetical protein